MSTISERLKEAMEIRQLRQADLAEKTKIGKSSISTYISGAYDPKQKNIYLLAKALDVNEAWLMGYDVPMERKPAPGSKQAFLSYLESLGYYLYKDDPEHKPSMGSDSIPSCMLEYDTLNSLKFRIDSFAKMTVDAELLALKEKEIKRERLEKERAIQLLRGNNAYKGSQFEKDRETAQPELMAAHNDNENDPEQQRLMREDLDDMNKDW